MILTLYSRCKFKIYYHVQSILPPTFLSLTCKYPFCSLPVPMRCWSKHNSGASDGNSETNFCCCSSHNWLYNGFWFNGFFSAGGGLRCTVGVDVNSWIFNSRQLVHIIYTHKLFTLQKVLSVQAYLLISHLFGQPLAFFVSY